MLSLVITLALSATAHSASSVFEQIVRLSVSNHFREYSQEVDMGRFESSSPIQKVIAEGLEEVSVSSTVWAEQQMTHQWGWFDCWTKLHIKGQGANRMVLDLGSHCLYQSE